MKSKLGDDKRRNQFAKEYQFSFLLVVALQFRKGTAAERDAATTVPLPGEPWFTVDDGQLYVGDGVTPGGVNVGANTSLNALTNVETIEEQVLSIATYLISSNAAVITTTTAHSYYTGLIISISDSPVTALNGTHTITDATPGTSVFVFTLTEDDVTVTATTGTITPQIPSGNALVWSQVDGQWQDGTPSLSVDDLTDVDTSTTGPTDGQYLTWDNTGGNWVPTTLSLGLDDLTDVDLATVTPSDGDLLVYDGTTSSFEPSTIDINSLSDVDTTTTTPSDGNVLTWDSTSNSWQPAASGAGSNVLHTTFIYDKGTAPTATISTSNSIGRNWGTWTEQTAANEPTNFSGPTSATFDPTISGITFDSSTGEFSNIPQGRYLINFSCSLRIDNPTPSFYTSPPALILVPFGSCNTSLSFYDPGSAFVGLLPYTSYGSAPAIIHHSVSFIYVADEATISDNVVQIVIDQDQSPAFYVDTADIDFIKLDG